MLLQVVTKEFSLSPSASDSAKGLLDSAKGQKFKPTLIPNTQITNSIAIARTRGEESIKCDEKKLSPHSFVKKSFTKNMGAGSMQLSKASLQIRDA